MACAGARAPLRALAACRLAWRSAVAPGAGALQSLAACPPLAPRPLAPLHAPLRRAGAARAAFGGARARPKGAKAPKETFLCRECGEDFPQSHGKCPSCGTWDSLAPFRVQDAPPVGGGGGAAARALARAAPLIPAPAAVASSQSGEASAPARRRASSWVTTSDVAQPLSELLMTAGEDKLWRYQLRGEVGAEVARVLGGGVVPGSLVLIGGDPGVGKSTLMLQLTALLAQPQDGADVASPNQGSGSGPVLYVSGEESGKQIASRAARLGLQGAGVQLLSATRVEAILESMAALAPRAVIVDSIQTVSLDEVTGSGGSVSQVRECATALLQAAKRSGAPVFLVGHVTKDGEIAGPRTLEHIVDVVLYLEGEKYREFRLLRALKNRFGAIDEIGVFSMEESGLVAVPNPSSLFLGRDVSPAGVAAAVTVTCQGTRPMALEIQALCAPVVAPERDGSERGGASSGAPQPQPFFPARRSATGVKPQRLHQLLAVLSKRALGPGLYSNDVYVNVVGGMQLDEPATDLALCAAVGAAFFDAPLPGDVAFVGEVGLGGELRAVPQTERRVAEAARLGFTRVLVPAVTAAAAAAAAAKHPGCRVVPCATVSAALEEALGSGVMGKSRGRKAAARKGAAPASADDDD